MRLLSIGNTAAELGVAVGTLRRWHRPGLLMPACRTIGGHRRYQRDAVRTAAGVEPALTGKTICYARVCSHVPSSSLSGSVALHAHKESIALLRVAAFAPARMERHGRHAASAEPARAAARSRVVRVLPVRTEIQPFALTILLDSQANGEIDQLERDCGYNA